MEWLQSLFSGESPALTLVLTFFAIAALLIASIWLFRKIAGGGSLKPNRNRQPRLSVTDAAIVDEKRRLVLVRRDNVEHLVMIGGPSDIVIEQNIIRTQPATLPQQREPRETNVVREPAMNEQPAPRQAEREPLVIEQPRESEADRAARMAAAQRAAAQKEAAERSILPELEQATEPAPAHRRAAVAAAAVAVAPVAAAEPELPSFEPQDYIEEVQLPELTDEPFAEPSPEPVLADLEIDFEGELQRSLDSQPPAPAEKPASLESELTAELSDDLDFARLLGEQEHAQAVPTITTPEPQKRRQEKVDDEMQRLLDELANA